MSGCAPVSPGRAGDTACLQEQGRSPHLSAQLPGLTGRFQGASQALQAPLCGISGCHRPLPAPMPWCPHPRGPTGQLWPRCPAPGTAAPRPRALLMATAPLGTAAGSPRWPQHPQHPARRQEPAAGDSSWVPPWLAELAEQTDTWGRCWIKVHGAKPPAWGCCCPPQAVPGGRES